MERTREDPEPYVGLSGLELIEWAVETGPTSLDIVGRDSVQARYLESVATSACVEWKDGFFRTPAEEIWEKRLTNRGMSGIIDGKLPETATASEEV